VAVVSTAWALRTAVLRLGISAEQGLYTIRVKLYDHIHRLSLADHNEERRGALVSRVTSDIETLTLFFSWGALVWLLDGSLMVVVACVMLSYDWILALVAFSVSAPLFFVLRSLQKRLVGAYDLARQNNAELLGSVSELVSGTETLRAYNAHAPMVARTKKAVKIRSESQVRAGVIGAFLFPSGEIFVIPAGIVTSSEAICPTLASAGTLLSNKIFFICKGSILVKIKPTFPDKNGKSLDNSGFFFKCSFKTFFMILFLPRIKMECFPIDFLHFLN
jgi:putative ABC transport system ATP-binding protein